MKISYAITVCNEEVELQNLLYHLLRFKKPQDEIVILYDSKNGSKGVEDYLRSHSVTADAGFTWHSDEFNNHFADWKNKLNSLCSGDFIFQIDADEYVIGECIDLIHEILEANPEVDLYYVPRINTVSGITPEHIQKWGWRYENGKVNWPDYQTRLYRNIPDIKWKNKVHEVIEGYKQYTVLPSVDELVLIHPKTIERQEKQNNFYESI